MTQTRVVLDESDIPTHWYNVVADLENPPAPPLGPDGQSVVPVPRDRHVRRFTVKVG